MGSQNKLCTLIITREGSGRTVLGSVLNDLVLTSDTSSEYLNLKVLKRHAKSQSRPQQEILGQGCCLRMIQH